MKAKKAILKLYVKGKAFPLFKCEIQDDPAPLIAQLVGDLNDRDLDVVRFGQICFKRDEFYHLDVIYKS